MIQTGRLQGVEIKVPGSIANLGPGLDTLAVAVRHYLRLRVVEVGSAKCGLLEFHFDHSPPAGQNRIESAFRLLADGDSRFPSMRLEVRSDIPMSAGLGSSAAATIAGFRLYECLFGKQSNERLLTAATRLEGHGDNAAASLLGGLAVCCRRQNGSMFAFTLPWPESLRLIVLTPAMKLPTERSRKALPDFIGLPDAVSNMQRVLLLLRSIQSGDDSLLAESLCDSFHQPARAPLVPGLNAALTLAHPSLLGVFLSGAGPSIVALARERCHEIADLLSTSYSRLGIPFGTAILQAHNSPALCSANSS